MRPLSQLLAAVLDAPLQHSPTPTPNDTHTTSADTPVYPRAGDRPSAATNGEKQTADRGRVVLASDRAGRVDADRRSRV